MQEAGEPLYWLIKYEHTKSAEEITRAVHSWNQHKQQFTLRQIEVAVKTLNKNHWLAF
ncbi:hypothetical protein Xsto_01350 [Xenorhabdus stockiae]|uniref:Uncharacterized protein n=1 Tax=Xenorhabdus stockiae TaxID=351614 RepID=A0A2D0KS31_9GAMM|nr:hypothetical protein Xsto_01350 [Xenorhabdus stockiae]